VNDGTPVGGAVGANVGTKVGELDGFNVIVGEEDGITVIDGDIVGLGDGTPAQVCKRAMNAKAA
jgi:hypothetical protein